MTTTGIIWFRQDLRLTDNPALTAAIKEHKEVIPVYIHDENHGAKWKIGSASKWWLHQSLVALNKEIDLVLRKGFEGLELIKLIKETGAKHVYWNRRYDLYSIKSDTELKHQLTEMGVVVKTFNGSLLFEPWEIKGTTSKNYKVFTPFWNACLKTGIDRLPLPRVLPKYSCAVKSLDLSQLELLPKKDWADGFSKYWQAGEKSALKNFDEFIDFKMNHYAIARDFPFKNATSHLSAHLHFGEISPTFIWHKVKQSEMEKGITNSASANFVREIGWREFSYHLLYYYQDLPDQNWRKEFDKFPWQNNPEFLKAWQKGKTGYPIVDAGMRQLWQTGYMHNRVRMIVASFLTKHLLIDWREGEKWFWDTLVDADLANNSCSWQWVAGSGADAAPYYRIFNPILQGEKFDPLGEYVRKWVPELSMLPNKYIHTPWLTPPNALNEAKLKLGRDYPHPIVAHEAQRKQALEVYKSISN